MNESRTSLSSTTVSANDLEPIMNARAIAVVGASKTELHELKLTGRPVKFLRKHGYTGKIFAVNPKYSELDGVPCYPSVSAIPEPVDVAGILLPKARIRETVEECGRKGVKAVMIFSSGFGELGAEGRREQDELVALAHRYGMRLVGPNAAGMISVGNRMVLSFLTCFGQQELQQGEIAFASNSGALLSTAVRLADDKGFHFSLLGSIGNEADVTLSDFAAHAVRDRETKVIAAFVEGIKDGPGLVRAATAAAHAGKPMVLVKVGTSERGGKVAASHTGAITGDDRAYSAAFRQFGITRAKDLTELVDVATMFARHRAPSVPGAVIVSCGSGGAAEMMADLADQHGVELVDFSPAVRAKLTELLTPFSILVNPIDIAGMTSDLNEEPQLFRRLMEYLLGETSVGFIGVIIPVLPYMDQLSRHIVELSRIFDKPIVPMLVGGGETPQCKATFAKHGIPYFDTAEQGARGLKALQDFAKFQARQRTASIGAAPELDARRRERSITALRTLQAAGRSTITLRDAAALLADYGLPLPPQVLARTPEEARSAARTLGFPLAM